MTPKPMVMNYLGEYYNCAPQPSFKKFCIELKILKMRANLSRIYKKSKLKEIQATNKLHDLVMKTLEKFLDACKNACNSDITRCRKENRYLTADEENMIVHIAKLMADMGVGICKTTCLHIIGAIMSSRNDSGDHTEPTVYVLDGILCNNNKLLKLISGNAIDPARVRQADANIRASVFVKIDNYIKLLNSMFKVP